MTFIETIPDEQASGVLAKLYERERADDGYVWNNTRAFSHRPDVLAGWNGSSATIRANMDLRRYELATLAAARRLRSSYCMLAHGSVMLAKGFAEPDELRAIATDHRAAGLDPVDVAVMDLADKVVADATSVTEADIDGLRATGLSDPEIFDVVLAAAARCFMSKVIDAVGALPDHEYEERLEPELREALDGRPADRRELGLALAAAPEDPRQRHRRAVEQRLAVALVLARRPLVVVVGDRRDVRELVGVVADVDRGLGVRLLVLPELHGMPSLHAVAVDVGR